MKHVINILLLGVILLGIAMMADDTSWGLAVALAPFAVWGARFLFFIHRSLWAAVIFWGGIAYFHWQVALAVGALFGLTWFIRAARSVYKEALPTRRRKKHAKHASEFQKSYDFDMRYHIGSEDE